MRELTVTLPDDVAEMVRRKVDSGEYPNESEVVLMALESLDHDFEPMRGPEIEQWLRSEVVPTYDAIEADASQVVTAQDVKTSLAALHEETLKARGGN
jgi:antitoxin ParD1/3/4